MNTFQEYVDSVFNFDKNQDSASYTERVGDPEEFPAVVGLISLNFQSLEDELRNRIIQMIGVDKEIGEIITAELSFKNLVNLFASLYHKLKDVYSFNTFKGYEDQYFKEIIKGLTKCEELRNQTLHSQIIQDWNTKQLIRKKTTAKARKGLLKVEKQVDIPFLFNISDYILSMEWEIDQFFMEYRDENLSDDGVKVN